MLVVFDFLPIIHLTLIKLDFKWWRNNTAKYTEIINDLELYNE